MPQGRSELGADGEAATARIYESTGFRVLAHNWRCRLGELDLVAAKGDLLVFCEVKTRRGSGFGGGWEAVTPRKQAKVRALAEAFLLACAHRPTRVRFDVASVLQRPGGLPEVEIFEDAF